MPNFTWRISLIWIFCFTLAMRMCALYFINFWKVTSILPLQKCVMVSLKFSSPSQAPQPMYWFKKNDSLATRCSLPACFRFHVREGPIQNPHHCGGLFCIVYRNYIYTHAVQTLGGVWYMIKESSDRKRGENSIQSSIKKCFRFFFSFWCNCDVHSVLLLLSSLWGRTSHSGFPPAHWCKLFVEESYRIPCPCICDPCLPPRSDMLL